MIRVRLDYEADSLKIYPEDVAADLDKDATDAQIRAALRSYIDESVTQGEWPSYTVAKGDFDEAIAAVKDALAAQEDVA